ncbi:MAG: COG1361 S-layer family protein [Candidatus Aenigmarchaeota archaeon]|nr:COG1361 S-layer family protein [Candidatus Aenigmarchaeota archaeon]
MKTHPILFGLIIVFLQFCAVFAAPTSGASIVDYNERSIISVSLVNQDPDPAISGDIIEVRIGIENKGGEAVNDLMVEVVPTYPFELVSGETGLLNAGTINGYQQNSEMKILKYRLRVNREASAGSYELKVRFYEEGSGQVSERTFSIDIQSRESAEVIYIDKTVLIPGKMSTMTFTINNVGSSPLRDLNFKWSNPDKIILPVGSDNAKYVRYIDVGESAELEYQVIADTNADVGLYELDLCLSYTDPLTGSEKTISTLAGVYVGGETDFDVAFSESSSGTTSFSIANIGNNPAYSVSVIVPSQRSWSVQGPNSVIIGNLNKGDYTVASFTLQQSGSTMQMPNGTRGVGMANATTDGIAAQDRDRNMTAFQNRTMQAQSSTILLQVAYTDTLGERRILDKEVQMASQSSGNTTFAMARTAGRNGTYPQSQGGLGNYVWLISGFIVLAGGFFLYRRHKKKKQASIEFKEGNFLSKKKK